MYAIALCDVQAFVMGLYFQFLFHRAGVNIVRAFQEGKAKHIDDQAGEIIEDG